LDRKGLQYRTQLLHQADNLHRRRGQRCKISDKEPVIVISTEKLYQTAGTYVGKDDPVGLVRCQSGLPSLGGVLVPFAFGHLVSGWMRGSHNGPLMPCSFDTAHPTRFGGPPRVIAAGFQMAEGKFVGPVDLFKDPAFDRARPICAGKLASRCLAGRTFLYSWPRRGVKEGYTALM